MSVTVAALEGMSLKELMQTQSRIASIVSKKHQAEIDLAHEKAKAESIKRANEASERVSQVAASLKTFEYSTPAASNGNGKVRVQAKKRPQKRKAAVVVRYRDPDNPAKTWSGKGPAPGWFKELMKASGKPKEHFLVSA